MELVFVYVCLTRPVALETWRDTGWPPGWPAGAMDLESWGGPIPDQGHGSRFPGVSLLPAGILISGPWGHGS